MRNDKRILVKLDDETHKTYKTICNKNGFNMSQRIRNFINSEIKMLSTNE
jgi:antitoxin component of RelBE/YafQ-DinJ toxin-antitoxin module